MDVSKAVSAYIERMITEVNGMKVLLLDQETVRGLSTPAARARAPGPDSPLILASQTPIISTAFTQSSLLSHEVYLTDRIENTSRDRMRHLKCIAMLRPTPASIEYLVRELREPRYGGYWICKCRYYGVCLRSSILLLNLPLLRQTLPTCSRNRA